ncbi:MAG: hypothetical protein JST75_14935 [Bacteroidetes bacterium]|nr:hypothetical protein [Bacteroidota bacterium]
MSGQKWHEKATVQAALVNAIPAFFVALISIIALVSTCNYSNKQISQAQNNFNKQMDRDSVLASQQDSVTKKQLELNMQQDSLAARQVELAKFQFELSNKQHVWDSISKKQELEILKKQYQLAQRQANELDTFNNSSVYIQKIKFITYSTPYTYQNVDSALGYPADIYYEWDRVNNRKDDHIQLIHCLSFYSWQKDYNEANDSILRLYNLPIFHKLSEAYKIFNERKMDTTIYPLPCSITKEYTVDFLIMNKGQLPIKILKSTSSRIVDKNKINQNCKCNSPQEGINDVIIYAGETLNYPISFSTPYDKILNTPFDFYIDFKYETIYGKMYEKQYRIGYDPETKSFSKFD